MGMFIFLYIFTVRSATKGMLFGIFDKFSFFLSVPFIFQSFKTFIISNYTLWSSLWRAKIGYILRI
ncbi:unnamed protein product [Schistosoma margrebowiei]|uniref:Uncharacterized protein n=1 Tax=Schistosoma margrebowiei TaxID=48269 RepID=A0A183N7P3_9TREM|nr:unnamed protein product [Schistosoma margrebowiei]